METVRWRKYVGAPNPPLITYLILSDLIRYVIRYSIALKDHEKDPGGTLYVFCMTIPKRFWVFDEKYETLSIYVTDSPYEKINKYAVIRQSF